MNFKKNTLSTSALLLAAMLTSGSVVQADDDKKYDDDNRYEQKYDKQDKKYSDDDDDRYDKDYYKQDKKYSDDDDDRYDKDYDKQDKQYSDDDDDRYDKDYDKQDKKYSDDDDDRYEQKDKYDGSISAQETWNNWTRTASFDKGNLPFSAPTKVTLQRDKAKGTDTVAFTAIPRDGELFVPGKVVADALGAKATVYVTSQILEITNGNTEMILKANTNVAYENNVNTPIPSVAFSMNYDIYVPISVITNSLGYSVEWQKKNNLFICRTVPIN